MIEMQQRNARAVIAIGCAVALLLPLVSIFDDDVLDGLNAVVVAEVVVLAALIALAAVHTQSHSLARVTLAALTDPRSPPRA